MKYFLRHFIRTIPGGFLLAAVLWLTYQASH